MKQLSKPVHVSIALFGISIYQSFKYLIFSLFAFYAPTSTCRHSPTCSKYAKQAIIKHGLIKGGFLALKQLLSCHPFHRHHNFL